MIKKTNVIVLVFTFILGISSQLSLADDNQLYPVSLAYKNRIIAVDEIHKIFVAEYGNPKGQPVLIVHGGPGGKTTENSYRLFDPNFYRIVVFDQRGSGKSIPSGEIRNNTTELLINDIERIRVELSIEKWILFGGSWGTALSLLYGEKYPERVQAFLLRGVTLAEPNSHHFKFYEMKRFYPDTYEQFVSFIPQLERTDLVKAYKNRIMSLDVEIQKNAAREFYLYNGFASKLSVTREALIKSFEDDPQGKINLLKIYIHYITNNYFLSNELQILNDKNIDKIKDIPLIIVHGRYDMNCPVERAYKLFKKWNSDKVLFFIHPLAGHSESDLYDLLLLGSKKIMEMKLL